ncbi:hypothetical protein AAHE18_04G007400 [Arachis hypogaea]|nr:protein N-lysine methyltransferase METTL21A isoform X1 [Arachis hypogaea]
MEATPNTQQQDDDDIVCLDASFFLNDNYQLTNFTFGSQDIQLFCLQSASTDFDLTGQLVWPGAMLLNDYLSKNVEMLRGCTAIELGSGVGITGILCSRFCHKVVMTDHNEEVLKILNKNIELHSCSDNTSPSSRGLFANKLEWGNSDQINDILQNHPGGFDLVLGADICFQQSSVPMLFNTVEQLLWAGEGRRCKFILAYVSRTKIMDSMIIIEASKHQMQMKEVPGTRRIVGNLEGVIYEITLGSKH